MRHFVQRYRYACVVLIVPALLVGCNRIAPSGESETMTLLRDGAQKVCIAGDVRKALRELIVPKPSDLSKDLFMEARVQAIAEVSLSYAPTTLESFDATVSRAACNTSVTLHEAGSETSETFRVDYAISPSAESANTFVVTADVADARAFATGLVKRALDEAAAKADDAYVAEVEVKERQALLATINTKWLRGAWIDANADSANCGSGQAVWFEAGNVLEGVLGQGRWTLTADQLHLTGGGFDKTGTIDAADAVSFRVSWSDGSNFSLRRCTQAEVQTLPDATGEEASQ